MSNPAHRHHSEPEENEAQMAALLDALITTLDDALERAMRQEVGLLTRAIVELGARYDEGRSEWWPMSMTRASDLTDSLRARIEAEGGRAEVAAADLLLRCNGFEIVALLGDLVARLRREEGAEAFRVGICEDGTGALLTLAWEGAALSVGRLDAWLEAPLDVGAADVSGRTVLATHATEIWPETRDGMRVLCLPIRQARLAGRPPPAIARAVVYDFDLLSAERAARVQDMALDALTCVVFDTETTGLDPATDKVIQLSMLHFSYDAQGIIKLGDMFDAYQDPGMPIPEAAE